MGKIKKAYADSRFRTRDSISDSDFKVELKEALDLPDNTVCYVDDISIPHTWIIIECHNNKLFICFLFLQWGISSAKNLLTDGTRLFPKYQRVITLGRIPHLLFKSY